MKEQPYTNLVCGFDITSQKSVIQKYLNDKGFALPVYYTNELSQDDVSGSLKKQLEELVSAYEVDSVIISTEPLMHYKYAKWALENNLNILMDKPITSERNISTDIKKANKIKGDYDELASEYKNRKQKGFVQAFSLMSQRRFHPAYTFIKDKIEEVFETTNCPLTSIQISHSDGQWRFPTEIVEQDYHPYNQGYGKVSHSGYHSLDMVNWFVGITSKGKKKIDNIDVFSSFVRPVDVISQFTMSDYRRLFSDFDDYNKYDEKEFCNLAKEYGEVDAFCNVAFKKGSTTMCLGSINLMHNGFGQRNWVCADGRDLYKGNGRIRQESYFIEQGPFQSIAFISYQSEEMNLKKNKKSYKFGDEWHLDIHIFRNSKMFPHWKSHEIFSIKDLSNEYMTGYSRGHQEDARVACIIDFFESIKNKTETQSDLLSHKSGTYLLSAVYESEIRKQKGENPLVNIII
jgi:hypothetical protein